MEQNISVIQRRFKMPTKQKSVYICSECGYESPKWVGKCPSCNAWNTMQEEIDVSPKAAVGYRAIQNTAVAKPLSEIKFSDELGKDVLDSLVDRIVVYKGKNKNEINFKILLKLWPLDNSDFSSGYILVTRGGNTRAQKEYEIRLNYQLELSTSVCSE